MFKVTTQKLSRWFSVWTVFVDRLKVVGVIILFVLVYVGLHKNSLALDDVILMYNLGDVCPLAATSTTFQGTEDHGMSVKTSSECLKRIRGKCNSTEHTVTLILANTIGRKVMHACSRLIKVVRKFHGEALHQTH